MKIKPIKVFQALAKVNHLIAFGEGVLSADEMAGAKNLQNRMALLTRSVLIAAWISKYRQFQVESGIDCQDEITNLNGLRQETVSPQELVDQLKALDEGFLRRASLATRLDASSGCAAASGAASGEPDTSLAAYQQCATLEATFQVDLFNSRHFDTTGKYDESKGYQYEYPTETQSLVNAVDEVEAFFEALGKDSSPGASPEAMTPAKLKRIIEDSVIRMNEFLLKECQLRATMLVHGEESIPLLRAMVKHQIDQGKVNKLSPLEEVIQAIATLGLTAYQIKQTPLLAGFLTGVTEFSEAALANARAAEQRDSYLANILLIWTFFMAQLEPLTRDFQTPQLREALFNELFDAGVFPFNQETWFYEFSHKKDNEFSREYQAFLRDLEKTHGADSEVTGLAQEPYRLNTIALSENVKNALYGAMRGNPQAKKLARRRFDQLFSQEQLRVVNAPWQYQTRYQDILRDVRGRTTPIASLTTGENLEEAAKIVGDAMKGLQDQVVPMVDQLPEVVECFDALPKPTPYQPKGSNTGAKKVKKSMSELFKRKVTASGDQVALERNALHNFYMRVVQDVKDRIGTLLEGNEALAAMRAYSPRLYELAMPSQRMLEAYPDSPVRLLLEKIGDPAHDVLLQRPELTRAAIAAARRDSDAADDARAEDDLSAARLDPSERDRGADAGPSAEAPGH